MRQYVIWSGLFQLTRKWLISFGWSGHTRHGHQIYSVWKSGSKGVWKISNVGVQCMHLIKPAGCRVELQTNVIRRFPKISQSWRMPLLGPYPGWKHSSSNSRCFQRGEGPSRGLLRDCKIFAYVYLRIATVWSSTAVSACHVTRWWLDIYHV